MHSYTRCMYQNPTRAVNNNIIVTHDELVTSMRTINKLENVEWLQHLQNSATIYNATSRMRAYQKNITVTVRDNGLYKSIDNWLMCIGDYTYRLTFKRISGTFISLRIECIDDTEGYDVNGNEYAPVAIDVLQNGIIDDVQHIDPIMLTTLSNLIKEFRGL